jgi:ribosomal protein S18 acetylase RimI-like enzyme
MPDLEPLLRFWRAQDELFDRVELTWWGAVVSDPRYPRIQEPNYARVETVQPATLGEIDAALLPALERSACRRAHVVVFFPEQQTDLVTEASTRGERLVWDLVMEHRGRVAPPVGGSVEEVTAFDDAFWRAYRGSARHFDITDEDVLDELEAIERDVLLPAGRRWYVVRDAAEEPVAVAALLVLEGIGYIDHVVTLPAARRRGYATAIAHRILAEVQASGAERTYLLAEPDSVAAGMYERLGFRRVTHLASWIALLGER